MKTLAFASRNGKEIVRDRINLAFGIGFPVILLLLLSAIQSNIPVKLFEIKHLTPGIAVLDFPLFRFFRYADCKGQNQFIYAAFVCFSP